MKAQINSIPQAKEELAEAMNHLTRIQVFMNSFQDVLDQFSSIREKLNAPALGNQPDAAQLSLAGRVLLIIRQMGHPVWPKAVAVEYESRNWPAPRSGTIYDAVNGAMSYLLHRRKLLGRNEEGYFIAPATLSEQVGGEKAGEATRA